MNADLSALTVMLVAFVIARSTSAFFIALPTALDVIKSPVLVNLAALQSSRVAPEAALADQLLVVLTRNNKPAYAVMRWRWRSSYFG